MSLKRKCVMYTVGCLLLSGTLAGCSGKSASGPSQSPSPSPDQQMGRLKVVYFLEQQFKREYGDAFHKKYPSIELQVIPMVQNVNGKTIMLDTKTIVDQKPDIVFGGNLIKELNGEGKLQELTPMLKQDKFDLNLLASEALGALKAMGDGRLVALSPDFQSDALYYNKDLFDQRGIPIPAAGMSWKGTLELAAKFAGSENGKPTYGIDYGQSPYSFLSRYVTGIGVNLFSEDRKQVRYAAEDAAAAVGKVVDAYKSGAVYLPPEKPASAPTKKEILLRSPFLAGDAAMAIADPSLITQLQEAASLGIPAFQWGLVPEPVNPAKPGVSSSAFVADAFAISVDTPNKALAWTFLKYLVSSDMADELAKTKPSVLPIRMDAVKDRDGHKLEPFYDLRLITTASAPAISPAVSQKIYELNSKELAEVLYGRETIEDGIQGLQRNAQTLLEQQAIPK